MNEPDNIILQYLRKFDAKLDRFEERMQDLTHRIASLETGVAKLHSDFAQLHTDLVSHPHRMDRMENDIDQIKRRLELNEPRH